MTLDTVLCLCEFYQIHEALNYDTISVHRLSDHSCKIMRIKLVIILD